MADTIAEFTRYAAVVPPSKGQPERWLGSSRGHNYTLRCAGYELVTFGQARLWLRKSDATKAAKGYGAVVVPFKCTSEAYDVG